MKCVQSHIFWRCNFSESSKFWSKYIVSFLHGIGTSMEIGSKPLSSQITPACSTPISRRSTSSALRVRSPEKHISSWSVQSRTGPQGGSQGRFNIKMPRSSASAKVQGLIPCRAPFADHNHSFLPSLLFETRVTFAQAIQESEYNLCMASGRYANCQVWPNSAAVSTRDVYYKAMRSLIRLQSIHTPGR